MATVTASSWSGIVSANNSFGSDTTNTIKLTQDIDLNNEYPSGVATLELKHYTGYYGTSRTWVLDGKDATTGQNHAIRNLRTSISNPSAIFKQKDDTLSSITVIFRNVDFVNCIVSGGDFFLNEYSSHKEYITLVVENCRFVGYRTGNAYLFNQPLNITCTSCYFDMPWYGAGSSSYDYCALIPNNSNPNSSNLAKANYCWFHESYGGWTIANMEEGQHSNCSPGSSIATTQCARFGMSGCYIDGSMKRPFSWNYSSGWKIGYTYCQVYYSSLASYFDSSTPNVIDVDWYVDQVSASSVSLRVYALNLSGVQKMSMNAPNFSGVDYYRSTATNKPNIILATPANMKNVTWLRSQGFPILEDTPSE